MKNYNKYYQTLFLILFFLLIAYSLPLNATVRFVSKTGLSIPPYTTPENAADSIQKCIDISFFGDTIYVANGVYQERVVMIPGLSLIGAGIDSCEINTQPFATTTSYRSVIVNDSCLLKGFKIVVAYNTELGGGIGGTAINSLITLNKITQAKYGIDNGSNVVIYNNIIENISSGVYLFNSDALVRRNIIYTDPNSQSVIIAGIRVQAFNNDYYPIIDSNYIMTVKEGIRKSINSRPTIKNNTIVLKSLSGVGMWLSSSDSAKVYNNLIIAEAGWQGIINNGTQYLILNNNYITGNLSSQQNTDYGITLSSYNTARNNVVTKTRQGVDVLGNQGLVYQYNNVWDSALPYTGITPDTTNLSVDPMVVNDDSTQGALDFHLQMYSPLIDAGDPTILDRDGSRSDIGLYGGPYGWTYTYEDLAPRPPHNVTAAIEEGLVKLTWNKNTEADFSHYRIYRDTVTIVIYDSTKMIAETPDTFYYDQLPPVNYETRYYYVITAFDNQGNRSYPSEEINVLVTGLGEHPPKGYDGYRLLANYPNPFNPYEVVFHPTLEERGKVTQLEVPMGKRYNQMSSGIYLYTIQVYDERNIPVFSDAEKMILLK